MDITVAICTWNRAELLDQTLTAMHQLQVPDDVEWELLVVDNNSTDDTAEVVASHQFKLPVRRLFESQQGHSFARNCAIAAARGEYLIWTDDDVLVDPLWLCGYVDAFRSFPAAQYFGGPIDPWFEKEPPEWLQRHWSWIKAVFVIRDYGPETRLMQANESPAGANMAFRTDVLRTHQFATHLGRVGATLTGADDSEMIQRLRDAEYPGVWIGGARVRHFLPAERLTSSFLAAFYHGAGRTQFRQAGTDGCREVFGVPRWVIFRYLQTQIRAWLYVPLKGERWFKAFRETQNLKGFMAECRSSRRASRLSGHRGK